MGVDDRIRILHMIDASKEAIAFIQTIEFQDFAKNRMLILSIIKEIEIIGEATSRISDETKLEYPNVLERYFAMKIYTNPPSLLYNFIMNNITFEL